MTRLWCLVLHLAATDDLSIGELKAGLFGREEVLAAARRVYRPGEADAAVR